MTRTVPPRSRDEVDEIKRRLPVPKVLDHLGIAHHGLGQKILCRWHDDTVPSCAVYEDHLYCFGCSERKDIVALWQQELGVEFREAIEALADMAGMSLDEPVSPELAFEQFCAERHLTRESLRTTWQATPLRWSGRPALRFPTPLGIDRIRFLDGSPPKATWAATGSTACWYGLEQALALLPQGATLYIVNGEPSVWACHQSGVPAVCTCIGESRVPVAKVLGELADLGGSVRVVYDLDEPGRRGAIALRDALRLAGVDCEALALPDDLRAKGDVDDLHRRVGDEGLAKALADLPALSEDATQVEAPNGGVSREQDAPDVPEHTDLSNAMRLVELRGEDLRYCHRWGKWLVWDGRRWAEDDTGAIYREARHVLAALKDDEERYRRTATQAQAAGDADAANRFQGRADKVRGHRQRSADRRRFEAMVSMAQAQAGIPIRPDDLDQAPYLLNVLNGTVDLNVKELRPHERADLCTRLAPVRYDPKAEAPLWHAFLDRIMADDEELIEFLQRAVGYSLTASVDEQVLFFCYGEGSNGKSVFLETIAAMMGDYADAAVAELLLASDRDRHLTEIAALQGRRFITGSEVDEGRRFAEAKLKALSGGDRISARRMHKDPFTFEPTHKLWLAANHKPKVRGTDHGFWRRIRLVPFAVTIPDGEQDKSLAHKLRGELSGILRWAVDGAYAWQRDGLCPPDKVLLATAAYREEQDVLGAFLSECTVEDAAAAVPFGKLYATYTAWCEDARERPWTKRTFAQRLGERGIEDVRQGGVRKRGGIRLVMRAETGAEGGHR